MTQSTAVPGASERPLLWIGSSHKDLVELPEKVQQAILLQLAVAQRGERPLGAKPLQGFGGASVMEISESFRGSAFRAIYTVRFADGIYVLHVFQKKSKRKKKTPPQDIKIIYSRLKVAEQVHAERSRKANSGKEDTR